MPLGVFTLSILVFTLLILSLPLLFGRPAAGMPGPFISLKGSPGNEFHMPEPERCNSPTFYCLTYSLSGGLKDFRTLWDAEEIGLTGHNCFANPTNPGGERKEWNRARMLSMSTRPVPCHQVRAYIYEADNIKDQRVENLSIGNPDSTDRPCRCPQ